MEYKRHEEVGFCSLKAEAGSMEHMATKTLLVLAVLYANVE